MAISNFEVLTLSPEDIAIANKLEIKLDVFLKSKWIGPETPFNTETVNLKYCICKELEKRYNRTGWYMEFSNPVVSHNNPFMIGAVQFEKALAYQPTEFRLTPHLLTIDSGKTKKKTKKVATKKKSRRNT